MKKDILTLLNYSKEELDKIINRSIELKKNYKKGILENSLANKSIGLIFDKPSTRTRISFEAATIQLGGTPIFMNAEDTQISRDEPVKDTARVLSRYIDALVIRTYSQELIEEFASYSTIPVINALSDVYHPCQILSDIMTVVEHKGSYNNIKITWLGDGNNVAQSWIVAAGILGLDLTLACPKDYYPNKVVLDKMLALKNGKITLTDDPKKAVKNADVIYTDVWASMGQEEEQSLRKKIFRDYQINSELLKSAASDHLVMHCLPAHRGEEISEEVLEGLNSIVWDQAENKLHLHKAVLDILVNRNK